MSTPLIAIETLLGDGFRLYARHLRQYLGITLWLLLIPIFSFLAMFFMSSYKEILFFRVPFALLSYLALIAVSVWTSIRLYRATLLFSQGSSLPAHDAKSGWAFFWAYLWIGILTVCATLGGFILLVIPGIWIGTAIAFAPFLLLDKNLRGTQSLSESIALVKSRWWAVFGRQILVGLVGFSLYMGIGIISSLIGGILSGLLDQVMTFNGVSTGMIVYTVLVQAASVLILVPLAAIWQSKIYVSLKETR